MNNKKGFIPPFNPDREAWVFSILDEMVQEQQTQFAAIREWMSELFRRELKTENRIQTELARQRDLDRQRKEEDRAALERQSQHIEQADFAIRQRVTRQLQIQKNRFKNPEQKQGFFAKITPNFIKNIFI